MLGEKNAVRLAGRRRLAVLAAAAVLVSGVITPAATVLMASPASAVIGDIATTNGSGSVLVADTGTGRYKDRITWVNWGAEGAKLEGGPWLRSATTTVKQLHEISDTHRLEVTCTMTRGYGQDVYVYRPGNFPSDGLPYLYGASGPGALVSGFATPNAATRDVSVSCSAVLATFKGTPSTQSIPLGGLVVADAESTNGSERLTATAPSGTAWHVIDRYPGTCTNVQYMADDRRVSTFDSRRVLTLGAVNQCGDGQRSATAVAFAENASQVDVSIRGNGVSAAAIGYVLGVDHGDAPATYGAGAAVVQPTWSAGTGVATTLLFGEETNVLASDFTLAAMSSSTPRLGAQVFPNSRFVGTPDATGDTGWAVPNGSNDVRTPTPDEDAFSTAPRITLNIGLAANHALTVRCTTGHVRAWLDWNNDGDYLDAGEATATVACSNSQATVTWTGVTATNELLGNRMLRVSIAATSSQLADPNGPIIAGEVEDWRVTLAPALTVAKTTDKATMPATGTVIVTTTITNNTAASLVAHLADDYSKAIDDVTMGSIVHPVGGTLNDNTTGRFSWSGSVAANSSVQIQYVTTMRSPVPQGADQILSDVVAVAGASITGTLSCEPGSAARNAATCARIDLYRPALSIDKQAFLVTDTEFTDEIDSNEPDALEPGTNVRWRYVVTNTGSTDVQDVAVSDSWSEHWTTVDGTSAPTTGVMSLSCRKGPPDTPVGATVTGAPALLGTLAPKDIWTCTASRAVMPNP